MKKTVVIILLLCAFTQVLSQTYYFAWDGVGYATRYNYNLGQSYGTYQYKGIAREIGVGFMEINQQFNLYYDMGEGPTGSNLRYNVNYYFIAPMVVFQLNKSGSSQCYVTAGIGEAQGGIVTLNRWSHLSWGQAGRYDSSIDETLNVNLITLRGGFGFTQFYHLAGNFHLFLNEDFGFLMSPDLATDNYTQSMYAQQFFQPSYISLRVGLAYITHSKDNDFPYVINH